MKKIFFSIALVMGLAAGTTTSSFALGLDFSALNKAVISFNGNTDTFQFVPNATGFSFEITSGLGLTDPQTTGLVGSITGAFTIGPITVVSTVPPRNETAPVSGTGTFLIKDENGVNFTATVAPTSIQTVGTSGSINGLEATNLTNISYAGSNTDLLNFAAQPAGLLTATFQFTPSKTLTQLTAAGATNQNSFSGTAAVPEPTSMLLLGSGLLGLGLWGRKRMQA